MTWRRWLTAVACVARRTRTVSLRLETLEDRLAPATWNPSFSGSAYRLDAVWGSGANDVFTVGDHGTILHSTNDGAAWQPLTSGATQTLNGVWGSASTDVFAVGAAGVILHSSNDGASWQTQTSGTTQNLNSVWGSGPNDVFVSAGGAILHSANDGASWQVEGPPEAPGTIYNSVWGSSPNDVFALGHVYTSDARFQYSIVVHSIDDGASWTTVENSPGPFENYRGVVRL